MPEKKTKDWVDQNQANRSQCHWFSALGAFLLEWEENNRVAQLYTMSDFLLGISWSADQQSF